MLACRGELAPVVIACALVVGCRTQSVAPVAIAGAASAVVPSAQDARSIKTFTISFATFIPADHLLGPGIHPQSYAGIFSPMRLAFAGDGRGFDVVATSFRAKQVVTVIPDQADDADGLLAGSKQNLGGVTESFEAQRALGDGRIDASDRAQTAGGRNIKHAEIAVQTNGMIIDDPVHLGPHRVFVRLRTTRPGGPRNGLIACSPSIDWDIGITIDTSGPEPTYEVAGTWDGYPAAELYINRQPVLLMTPGAWPAWPWDLLKLLPGIGDCRFVREGRLANAGMGTED
jgi:hypothetical protein